MRLLSLKGIFSLITLLCGVSSIWAQSVYWSPSSGTLQKGKVNSIDLFFDSCEPDGEPSVPNLDRVSLNFRGQSNSRTIINGRVSSKIIFNYQAIPTTLGELVIPAFEVKTSQGTFEVAEARFQVIEATVGNTGLSPSEVFLSLFQNRDEKIYQGEVFELEYIAGAKQDYQLADLSTPDWNPSKLVTGGLVDAQVTGVNYNGSKYTVKVYQAKVMATESGTIEIPGASQEATVVIGRRRDFMFQEPVYDQFTIESDPFALEIHPLPEGAPASFKGAVGNFSLESRVVPEQVQVGEPVTWTLELSGTGNWPSGIGVPERSVSSRFKAIQPEIRNDFDENNLFTGTQTEDIVLIPTEEGTFEFGPVQYTYFDAKEEKYKTIQIPAKTVTVTPAVANSPNASGSTNTGAGESQDSQYGGQSYDLDPNGQSTFDKPPALLADVKDGNTIGTRPARSIPIIPATVVALASPLAFWLLLAFGRSIVTDPRKPQRQALADLKRIARSPVPSDQVARKEVHLKWRDAACRYFDLSTSEPTPDEISQAAGELRDGDFSEKWKKAWIASDRELFGAKAPETQVWDQLQKEATEGTPSKGYSPALAFKRSAWLPLIAATLLACLPSGDLRAQEAPSSLYEQGDFQTASDQWLKAVNDQPYVFENRYNAGLALAQKGDWAKAWGLWTSAYCLNPQSEELAWNLRIAHQNTSSYDPILQALLEKDGLYTFVGWLSPAGWQALALQSLWGLGIALALAILFMYLKPLKRFSGIALLLAVAIGLLSYFSAWASSKYEALGDPDTLLVVGETALLSIPTDLQAEQISSLVAEGTVAKKSKTFLSWVKIDLPNGESGWVRKESLMPLYGPLNAL
ncbi:BatD family protein [Pelagicoccus albus]|uniref:BatD family protein n=1 Tax=Pelagicoccus albus TaxID=415222 RepID=A0A7X1E9R3_9BACT|nr:BatD family protein [Pelagicoccus albus]MBC2607458.1 BatD family protein [Pelagicoccus albus]